MLTFLRNEIANLAPPEWGKFCLSKFFFIIHLEIVLASIERIDFESF